MSGYMSVERVMFDGQTPRESQLLKKEKQKEKEMKTVKKDKCEFELNSDSLGREKEKSLL